MGTMLVTDPRSSRVLGAVALLSVLLLPACGGGGGGSSFVPTQPPEPEPPSGPPPTTEEPGDETLFGEVEGMFDPTVSFAGATVRVVGVGEDTVRTDNSFFIDPVAAGEYVLTVSGPTVLHRKVEIEMQAGGANEISRLDIVELAPFNIDAFDEIYRSEGERGTARFVDRPDFYIDQKSFDSLPGGTGARLISEIDMATRGDIRRAVGRLFAGVQVTTRNVKQYSSPCELPAGDVNWYADRELRDENGQRLLGRAWWCWYPAFNQVRGGMLYLDALAGTGTILHELVHIIGTADHLERASGTSIIEAPRSISQLSPMDEMHLGFLYARPPGLMTPDDARGLGTAGLTGLASGSGMEMRCTLYPDGRVVLERGYPGSLVR